MVLTVGHSTRAIDEFVSLLRSHGVRSLVDVRRYPGSRRHPQFAREALAASLAEASIDYVHEEALGGRRSPVPGSGNVALRNLQFRGYADHMATREFAAAIGRLLGMGVPAVMCAEAVPWRCHRWLLADALVARGVVVEHILDEAKRSTHTLNPEAVVTDGIVRYPGGARLFDE